MKRVLAYVIGIAAFALGAYLLSGTWDAPRTPAIRCTIPMPDGHGIEVRDAEACAAFERRRSAPGSRLPERQSPGAKEKP